MRLVGMRPHVLAQLLFQDLLYFVSFERRRRSGRSGKSCIRIGQCNTSSTHPHCHFVPSSALFSRSSSTHGKEEMQPPHLLFNPPFPHTLPTTATNTDVSPHIRSETRVGSWPSMCAGKACSGRLMRERSIGRVLGKMVK